MAKQIIAADYEGVKASIKQMEDDINQILSAADSLEKFIDSANEWKGPDAASYKIVLHNYMKRIKNSSKWLDNLDQIITKHSYALYQRALNDKNASTFR